MTRRLHPTPMPRGHERLLGDAIRAREPFDHREELTPGGAGAPGSSAYVLKDVRPFPKTLERKRPVNGPARFFDIPDDLLIRTCFKPEPRPAQETLGV